MGTDIAIDGPGLRRLIFNTGFRSGEAQHYASCFSCADILVALYGHVLVASDIFILSKGHAALALYAALALTGKIDMEDLAGFGRAGSILAGHPPPGLPGVFAATGSLGHGLPIGVGAAYAKRIAGEPGRVFVLAGDGEMQEGSMIEGMRLAHHFDCPGLRVIVDSNDSHGWPVVSGFKRSIVDGHDVQAVIKACDAYSTEPVIVEARTTRGKGSRTMEKAAAAWHRRLATNDEALAIWKELGGDV